MYPHRIRLRGPWECTPVGDQPRRATVPCDLAGDAPVLLTRKFGYPGRIDAGEHVWLTVAGVTGSARVALNGQALGEVRDTSFEKDVTSLLQPRNQVQLLVEGRGVGEVALEVRADAFLQGVRVERAGDQWQATGAVAGQCAGPLELYVLVDGRHVHYQTIEAGAAFAADLPDGGRLVRLELVHISTVWYAVELPLDI